MEGVSNCSFSSPSLYLKNNGHAYRAVVLKLHLMKPWGSYKKVDRMERKIDKEWGGREGQDLRPAQFQSQLLC